MADLFELQTVMVSVFHIRFFVSYQRKKIVFVCEDLEMILNQRGQNFGK